MCGHNISSSFMALVVAVLGFATQVRAADAIKLTCLVNYQEQRGTSQVVHSVSFEPNKEFKLLYFDVYGKTYFANAIKSYSLDTETCDYLSTALCDKVDNVVNCTDGIRTIFKALGYKDEKAEIKCQVTGGQCN